MCVPVWLQFQSVCRPAGLGNRWRFRANSADAGVEKPAMELRLWGKVLLLDWGPSWRTDVMEPAFSWTSLSPTVCSFHCLSGALTAEPPAGLPVCLILYTLCDCCPESSPVSLPPFFIYLPLHFQKLSYIIIIPNCRVKPFLCNTQEQMRSGTFPGQSLDDSSSFIYIRLVQVSGHAPNNS